MAQITNTTQLSIFSLIRSAIKANSTLLTKFSDRNILQYEPKHKSSSFVGFPYIVVKIPVTETEFVTLDHSDTEKSLDVTLILRMDYLAKDNFLNYANALIKAIESYESTFDTNGYFNTEINVRSVDEVANDQKDLIEGTFILSYLGSVGR